MEERKEVLENVIEFAARAYNRSASDIKESTKISEELGGQSMQHVALSASIENEYDVMIPVARMGQFETIGDLVDHILDEM